MTRSFLPGKLPPDILAAILSRNPVSDPRVILGPRVGEDAAVLDMGADTYLIAKTDPITLASDEIGWYAVNVNANDIAVTGGVPAWFMATLLLPENGTTPASVERIFDQIVVACDALGIALVGGHTEITQDIDRPIVVGTMLGLVGRDRVVRTGGARPGDVLLVTKGVPIEATSIIAREKAGALAGRFDSAFLRRCADYLRQPGISVIRDVAVATASGRVHAMHDPTEGGLATGLWEMADAAGRRLVVDPSPAILDDGGRLCATLGIDPLGAIASGALLMSVHPEDASAIASALEAAGIPAFQIGRVEKGPAQVIDLRLGQPLRRFAQDEIARLFDQV
jgi:hydrogenase maturation factor